MIVLDTNVLSEMIRHDPAIEVVRWLAAQNPEASFTTSLTQAEILRGLALLPDGRRKSILTRAVEMMLTQEFSGRILAFDEDAAPIYASIVADRTRLGRPISQSDAMIAAICKSRGAVIATRNVADFEHCGIPVVNPWSSDV